MYQYKIIEQREFVCNSIDGSFKQKLLKIFGNISSFFVAMATIIWNAVFVHDEINEALSIDQRRY